MNKAECKFYNVIVYLLINRVLQWLTIVKGLVGRERPPFLNALHIEPFEWTPSNSPNVFGVTWFFLSFYFLYPLLYHASLE